MSKDPKELVAQFKGRQKDIRDALPELMKHFAATMQVGFGDGVLDAKTKELATLAISVAVRCDYCIALHVANCLKAGATREEVMEICGVAIAMGGGPSYTYTAFVLDCLDAAEQGG
jgi:AhpD family alkylhydroperoxidase